jgi:dienelactone hydrolase
VIARVFHAWERHLASIDTTRTVRPFGWGLDLLGLDAAEEEPGARIARWANGVVADSHQFFTAPPTTQYDWDGDRLRFPSAVETPHASNNTVTARYFRGRRGGSADPRRAVVVLPQWNADAHGHMGLCEIFARFGISALRLTLPYHEERRPEELQRAEHIVSPNIGRTLQVNRQAVLDIRRLVDWLVADGYERIGIVGTSLGSCLSMLAMTHDPRIRIGAFNHVSPFFADVVWHGLSTWHVRASLEDHVSLDDLRTYWMPISPWPFLKRIDSRPLLMVYARYDLTFPVPLSLKLIDELGRLGMAPQVKVLPCGHYTTGKAPFKFLDGYYLTRFLLKHL